MHKNNKYLLCLSIIFMLWCIVLGISPYNREDWMLENVLVFVAVIIIIVIHKNIPLSSISYTLIFIFLSLHEIGSHYTYSNTPYNEFFQIIFGFSLNDFMGFERNHYDRLIHLSYGLLLAYPVRELFMRIADVKGFWGYFFPLIITMSTSMIYELLEWAAALLFGGDLGITFLGTQGDVWDAHKDMALASLGAMMAMLITALVNVHLQRDFAKEWNESLKIK